MAGIRIEISGWTMTRARLKTFKGRLPPAVKAAARDAAEPVAAQARMRMPIGPAQRGHVRSSVRVATTRGGVAIRAGGARFPYYPWLEFGGRVGRRKRTYRTRVKSGRYLYPALAANREQIRRTMHRHLVRAANGSGLRTRGGGA